MTLELTINTANAAGGVRSGRLGRHVPTATIGDFLAQVASSQGRLN